MKRSGSTPMVRTLSEMTLVVIVMLTILMVSSDYALQATQGLSADESAYFSTYSTLVASVDFGRVIGKNNLSLGAVIHGYDDFPYKPTLQAKARIVGFKIVRVFIAKDKYTQPCLFWNETSSTGSFNWSQIDPLVNSIYRIGAEPLLNVANTPPGMTQNYMGTGFPNPRSFGVFAARIVSHMKSIGRNVRYWEVLRVPQIRNSTGWIDAGLVMNYTKFFNVVQYFIHLADPNALVTSERMFHQDFFDVFAKYAKGVGYLPYIKYDNSGLPDYRPWGYTSGDRAMQLAGVLDRPSTGAWAIYSPKEMQRRWFTLRGQILPVIVDEANLNCVYGGGTDERIQQPLGGAWYAQALRSFILDGTVRYSTYYQYCSHQYYLGGWGLGMINSTYPHTAWYPYWTNYLFGSNLRVGNSLFYTHAQNSTLVSLLAWGNSTHYFVAVIGKTSGTFNVNLQLFNGRINSGAPLRVYRLDKQYNGLVSQGITYTNPVRLSSVGYSVTLIIIRRSS